MTYDNNTTAHNIIIYLIPYSAKQIGHLTRRYDLATKRRYLALRSSVVFALHYYIERIYCYQRKILIPVQNGSTRPRFVLISKIHKYFKVCFP